MARTTVTVEGLRELEQALRELSKTTGKAVLRRTLLEAAEPMRVVAQATAPEFRGDLKVSVGASTKLGKRQGKLHRRMFRNDRAAAEVFVGAGVLPQAHLQEFGTARHEPQPFMRPAWDAEKRPTLDRIVTALAANIAKTAARVARRAARLAGKA